jgi:hypothetical protein
MVTTSNGAAPAVNARLAARRHGKSVTMHVRSAARLGPSADAAISAVLSCAITAPRAIVRTVAGGTAAHNGFAMLPVDDARHRFEARGCYRLRAARILLENVIETADVPPIHRDPFDRALVAQAQCNGLHSFVARLSWSSSAV